MIGILENWKSKIEGEDMLSVRLAIIFVFALLTNIVGCAFGYATSHKMVGWVIPLGFMLPIINFTISLLFLEAKSLREEERLS